MSSPALSAAEAKNNLLSGLTVALALVPEAIGKRLHLRHLSPDCQELLARRGLIEADPAHDPHYHIADDQLG